MITADDIKREVIKLGLEEIREAYTEENYRRIGAEEGFELCKNLHLMEDFEKVIVSRHKREARMRRGIKRIKDGKTEIDPDVYAMVRAEMGLNVGPPILCTEDEYWQHRYATLQIEFVHERLLVLWGEPVLSAKATIQVNGIIQKLKDVE